MYIITWTLNRKSKKYGANDRYQTHETIEKALDHYNKLSNNNEVTRVNLSIIIK